MPNATHLFERPARHRHHSEAWWSAFFSLVLLYRAQTAPQFTLPIYTYRCRRYRQVGHLGVEGLSFDTVAVEAPLSERAFGLAAWPPKFLNLKPDLSVIVLAEQQATFIETKTIGATIARNLDRYSKLCVHLNQNGWAVNLFYLLSHGHESPNDWSLITQKDLRILLWEDVLRSAIGTPLACVFDVDLTVYATHPAEPIDRE